MASPTIPTAIYCRYAAAAATTFEVNAAGEEMYPFETRPSVLYKEHKQCNVLAQDNGKLYTCIAMGCDKSDLDTLCLNYPSSKRK